MNCEKHPKYKAIRKPRTSCRDCWNMYNAKRNLMTVEIKTEEGWQTSDFKDIEVGSIFRLVHPDTNTVFENDNGKNEFKSETEPYKNEDGVLMVDVED